MPHSASNGLTPKELQLLNEFLENNYWNFKNNFDQSHQDFLKNPKCMLAVLHSDQFSDAAFISHILFAQNELNNNKEFMLAVMRKYKYAIMLASEELKNDADFMLAAMRIDKGAFLYASNELKRNEEFMLAAIAIDTGCIRDALPPLFEDPSFETKAMIRTPQAAYHVYEPASILAAIKSNPVVIAHLQQYYLEDEHFIKQALHSNPKAIQHLRLGIKFRPSIFWNIQCLDLESQAINRYKTQFLMLESLKALASIAMATVGVLLVASVISSPFALALGLPLIGLAVLCLGWMTKSHLEARYQSQIHDLLYGPSAPVNRS